LHLVEDGRSHTFEVDKPLEEDVRPGTIPVAGKLLVVDKLLVTDNFPDVLREVDKEGSQNLGEVGTGQRLLSLHWQLPIAGCCCTKESCDTRRRLGG